ncbi:unnamed protein product, partial [Didymodactylos carnosus]
LEESDGLPLIFNEQENISSENDLQPSVHLPSGPTVLTNSTNTVTTTTVAKTMNNIEKELAQVEMKDLCRKILLIKSPVLSFSKLNKSLSCYSMVDVHKACDLLIQKKLLEKRNNLLGNTQKYFDSYLKLLPVNMQETVKFAGLLKEF